MDDQQPKKNNFRLNNYRLLRDFFQLLWRWERKSSSLTSLFVLTILFLILLYVPVSFFLSLSRLLLNIFQLITSSSFPSKLCFLTEVSISLFPFKILWPHSFYLFTFFISSAHVIEVIFETGNHAHLVPLPASYSTLYKFPDHWINYLLLLTNIFRLPSIFCHFSFF